jgi:putative addiction module component (TIGR02574 family)
LKGLLKRAEKLPQADRAFLAERLLESLDADEIEAAWLEEAMCRRDAVRSGKSKVIPSEAVYRRANEILKK